MDRFRKYMEKEVRDINIVCVSANFGGNVNGAQYGAQKLLEHNFEILSQNIKIYNVDFQSILFNKIPNKYGMNNCSQVVEVNKKVYENVKKILFEDNFPIIIGGDHSISAGSVMAISEKYDNLGVIWIDAHADFNDEDITNTGNMHGMSLSAICGYGPNCMIDYSKGKIIKRRNVVIIGGRDFEPKEIEKLNNLGIKYYLMSDIRKMGIKAVFEETKNYLMQNNRYIHVSFDIDSISPEYAPGTGTPVADGFNIEEIDYLMSELVCLPELVSMDIVELNPLLDMDNKTINIANNILNKFIKKEH